MMRTVRRRLLAILALGAFSLAGATDAAGVQPCPHHDHEAGHHEDGAHAGHHHPDPGQHHAGKDPHAECDHEVVDPAGSDEAVPCGCEGVCALGVQTLAPQPADGTELPGVATLRTTHLLPDAVQLPGRAPFTLPYATAPPLG